MPRPRCDHPRAERSLIGIGTKVVADDSRVIVAGAGPVGLVAALVLADAGVPVVVLEKRDGLNTASKASTFHAPTLEILDKLGVLQEVIDHGAMVDRAQFRTAVGGIFAEFPLTLLTGETPFPFRLHLEQARVTPLLLRRLRGHAHAAVAFDAEVSGVATEPRGVRVTIRANGRPHEMVGRFLIGADGARSQVRTAIGATFDGEDYPDKILRVMTDEDLNRLVPGIAPITYLFNGMKSVSFLKMPECWRIILRVPKGIPDQQALEPAWILSRLQEAMPQCRNLPHVVAKDVYGVSRRVADPFRSGRVFLIGDAAHLTNTRGG
ncbi:MAG: FAD-dependent monooxygenase, partial [Alphaproteobacteria bacterium]|nr:FAD-dependent monooxygenase [Alphaproteobacteria bacterium]